MLTLALMSPLAVSTRSNKRPSGVLGSTRRLPGLIEHYSDALACNLGPLLNPLMASISIDQIYLSMEELGCSGDVMRLGQGSLERVDQAGILFSTVALDSPGAVRHFYSVGVAPRSGNTTGYLPGSGASLDPVHRFCFWWNSERRLRLNQ